MNSLKPSDQVLILVQGIEKAFGQKVILKNISFEVYTGEVVVIIGPSGSGKTTLLRCLNLLGPPDKGVMRIGKFSLRFCPEYANGFLAGIKKSVFGQQSLSHVRRLGNGNLQEYPLTNPELRELREFVGIVFQQYNLWPNKTAMENITESLKSVRKLSKKEAEERALAITKELGICDKLNSYPTEMSGGQQQRLALARTLAMEPQVLLLDEITAALDIELVEGILEILKDLRDKGRTMIIVTHHIEFARQIADEILFLDNGEIVERGSPEEILRAPKEKRTQEFLQKIIAAR